MVGRVPDEQIVVLGEDDHDRRALKILLCGLRPDIPAGRVRPLREPMALVKDVSRARIPAKTARVSAALRAVAARQPIRCVLMHEDADDYEPAHRTIAVRISEAYKDLPWPVVPVVPAWELETWWFLFPAAVGALHLSWIAPDRHAGRDLGRIGNAKEELRRAVRPRDPRARHVRDYAESDSPLIAEHVVRLGLLNPPWAARSDSWLVFVAAVATL